MKCDECGGSGKTTWKDIKDKFIMTLLAVIAMFPVAYFVIFHLCK